MPTTTSWIAVNDGSGITIWPLYLGWVRSDHVRGRSAGATLSVRIGMPTSCRRCAIHLPSRSLASSTTLSNPSGRNGSRMPCLARPLAAPASDMVSTSAPGRPALSSCCSRRSTACPPERRSCTLIPVCCSNVLASCCACATGVDVYQLTERSRRAASMSTGSAASAANPAITNANANRTRQVTGSSQNAALMAADIFSKHDKVVCAKERVANGAWRTGRVRCRCLLANRAWSTGPNSLFAVRHSLSALPGGHHEVDRTPASRLRRAGLSVHARLLCRRGSRDAAHRGRDHSGAGAPGGLAREDGRAAHGFCGAHVQQTVPPDGAPSAAGRAAAAIVRRAGLRPPVQDQRQGGVRRRRLAMAPGLRNLGARRRHARAARHEYRDFSG